jgi:hypothetical protein
MGERIADREADMTTGGHLETVAMLAIAVSDARRFIVPDVLSLPAMIDRRELDSPACKLRAAGERLGGLLLVTGGMPPHIACSIKRSSSTGACASR